MATPARPAPRMPPEITAQLQQMQAMIDKAWGDIGALEKIGMDTTALKDKLKWAEEARKTLLTQFA